jgi:hypothetical protein
VARAKRTDRAEARRKYRAYLLAQEEADAAESEGSDSPAKPAISRPVRDRYQDSRSESVPPVRMGIMAAARTAYHTPTYRSDLRYFRTLVFRSNAVWPIVLICVLAGGYSVMRLNDYSTDPILPVIFSFIFYPPLIPPMLAGFLAPRATWMAGLIASFLCTVTMILVLYVGGVTLPQATGVATPTPTITPSATTARVASASATAAPTASLTPAPTPTPSIAASGASVSPTPTATVTASPTATASATASASPRASTAAASPSASPSGSTTTTTGASAVSDLFTYAWILLLQSLTIGALIGALSGWYKRFLALTSAPRKPISRSGGSRGAQRRRPTTRK